MLVDCLPYRFFGLSLTHSSDLNHLSNQVHFAKNINELITQANDQWWEGNDSDVTFYRILSTAMPTSICMYTQFSVLRMQVTMQISLLRNWENCVNVEIPTACRFRLSGTAQQQKNTLKQFF